MCANRRRTILHGIKKPRAGDRDSLANHSHPRIPREAVVVYLSNENRPSVWEQVSDYIEKHGEIGNAEVRKLMRISDTLRASKQLKVWVDLGLLVVANPESAKQFRKYTKPDVEPSDTLFSKARGKH